MQRRQKPLLAGPFAFMKLYLRRTLVQQNIYAAERKPILHDRCTLHNPCTINTQFQKHYSKHKQRQ